MKKLKGKFFEPKTKLEDIVTDICNEKQKNKDNNAFYM
jgi:hypothetical protein